MILIDQYLKNLWNHRNHRNLRNKNQWVEREIKYIKVSLY